MPEISVVLSVFNGADSLSRTLDSVLSQEDADFEVIAINDGSSDGSRKLLDEYAGKDKRIKAIHQDNKGLTRALIRGCQLASGQYIARQDVGDRSLSGRFAAQLGVLNQNPEIVLVACGTRYFDLEGNHLFDAVQTGDELDRKLRATSEKQLRGPSHHGSVMFRKDAYEKSGGYRLPFYVAQDLDLWTRMVENGTCIAIPEIMYEATWTPGCISHLKRKQQVIATHAILECRKLRLQGKEEQPILVRLKKELNRNNQTVPYFNGLHKSRYHYFAGSLLRKKDPQAAKKHFDQAITAWPMHLKAWLKRFGLLRL
jgi:glycosyltransferase involved in cell wall biosynthesis